MGSLHKFAKVVLGALPKTDCENCLQVRHNIEGFVLSAETALSKTLGLVIGDKVSTEQNADQKICVEIKVPTAAETKSLIKDLGMSPAEFATACGMSEEKLAARFEQGDKILELKVA